jgi:drug/metabolite transporter (DMT)-like permease
VTTIRSAEWRLVLSSALFAFMAVLAKIATRHVPGPEAACVRFATGAVLIIALAARGHIDLRPRRWGWLFARGFFGGSAVLLYFTAIQTIPVGEATLLNYTQPVFTMLGAWLMLGERPPRRALVALPITLFGVSLVVGIRLADLHAGGGALMGLASAVLSGGAVTAIRATRRQVEGGPPAESAWSVFASFTFLGLLVTLPAVLPPFGRWVPPTGREWALLLGVGVSSAIAQMIMTEALQHVRVDRAGLISQLTAAFSIGGGALLLGERLSPGFVAGALVTLAGVMLVTLGGQTRLFEKLRRERL